MQDFANKKILLGITGSIAAFKAPLLIRELTALGADVRVVLSSSASNFISSLTLQALSGNEVRTDLFDAQAESGMSHIELARWADYLLIAPASANCLAKMAHGFGEDLLSTLYLVAKIPVIVCPAMNSMMWHHPATQANCSLLSNRGVLILGPEEGIQACGEEGFGRMSEVFDIVEALRLYPISHKLTGQKVLITAGPTQEAIDPVRYISNHSSGKMGYALARAANLAGAKVILISGPTHLAPPPGVETHFVQSACEMHRLVIEKLEENMIFIGSAAVADYHLAEVSITKIKKTAETLTLQLHPNPDILREVAKSNKARFVVGFAAETDEVIKHAQSKLISKKVDMIIANQVGPTQGFNQEMNQAIVITKNNQIELPLMQKTRLAGRIIAILATNLQTIANSQYLREKTLC